MKLLIGMVIGGVVGGVIGALYERNRLPGLVQQQINAIRPAIIPAPVVTAPIGPTMAPAGFGYIPRPRWG